MSFSPTAPSFIALPGEVGFLAEDRRLNVAVTRARRHLAVVCDAQTIRQHAFLRSLLDHLTQRGEVRSAFQYLEDAVPMNYTHEPSQPSARPQPKPRAKPREKDRKEPGPRQAPQGRSGPSQSAVRDRGAPEATADDGAEKVEGKGKEEQLREELLMFQKDPARAVLSFPSTLSSHARMLVHRISEELGLSHESVGEGKNRRITVSKQEGGPGQPDQSASPVSPGEQPDQPASCTGSTENTVQSASSSGATDHPDQSASSAGATGSERGASSLAQVDLKNLHLERMQREQAKRNQKAQGSPAPAQPSKNSKRSAKGEA